MKLFFGGICSICLVFLVACGQNSSSTVELGEAYGEVAVDTAQALAVQDFFSDFEQQDSQGTYTVRGRIVEMCQRAGCWVGINKELDDSSEEYFVVRFKDHFTIPTDTKKGTTVYFHGTASWDSTSVETLKEIAFQEGKSSFEIEAIDSPEYSFDFEADGIVLSKNQQE